MRGAGAMSLGALGLGGWTFVLEPGFLLDVTRYSVTPPKWPAGLELTCFVGLCLGLDQPKKKPWAWDPGLACDLRP